MTLGSSCGSYVVTSCRPGQGGVSPRGQPLRETNTGLNLARVKAPVEGQLRRGLPVLCDRRLRSS